MYIKPDLLSSLLEMFGENPAIEIIEEIGKKVQKRTIPKKKAPALPKRRGRFSGDHPPMDKEHHPASRKSQRESTPATHHGQSLPAGWQS